MVISSRSKMIGTSLALAAVAGLSLSACEQGQDDAADVTAESEAVSVGGGMDIDPAIVNFYLESRTQRPAEQATAEQREAILQEITDIYLLTSQPVADELLATSDQLKAQL